MTKKELLELIIFKDAQEKEEANFYISVKGIELHYKIIKFLKKSDLQSEKIEWEKISYVLKNDKSIRDKLYIYLATLEEYIRAYIANKYEDNVHQNFWINGKGERNQIKNNIKKGKNLFDVLEDTDFGCLIEQVKKLPSKDQEELFNCSYNNDNLDAIRELRNAISHHKFLNEYNFKECIVSDVKNNSLINNIKNLRQLLPREYWYGEDGKGGLTKDMKKLGINLD